MNGKELTIPKARGITAHPYPHVCQKLVIKNWEKIKRAVKAQWQSTETRILCGGSA
jgi:hypothetical protein